MMIGDTMLAVNGSNVHYDQGVLCYWNIEYQDLVPNMQARGFTCALSYKFTFYCFTF